jgi:hypothetical protein
MFQDPTTTSPPPYAEQVQKGPNEGRRLATFAKLINKGTGANRLRRMSVAIRSAALRRGERPTSSPTKAPTGTYNHVKNKLLENRHSPLANPGLHRRHR